MGRLDKDDAPPTGAGDERAPDTGAVDEEMEDVPRSPRMDDAASLARTASPEPNAGKGTESRTPISSPPRRTPIPPREESPLLARTPTPLREESPLSEEEEQDDPPPAPEPEPQHAYVVCRPRFRQSLTQECSTKTRTRRGAAQGRTANAAAKVPNKRKAASPPPTEPRELRKRTRAVDYRL